MREDIIANALADRFNELCKTHVLHLAPQEFGEAARFVSQIREQLISASPESFRSSNFSRIVPGVWMNSGMDCLSSLQALSLGNPLQLSEATYPPVDSFVDELDKHKREPARRFQILTERYACPLNFALPAEDEIREYVLTRLMVQDRALIETHSVKEVDGEDLLLKLNLIGMHAQVTSDLRFFDALNYYFELLPVNWVPYARRNWLLASWLALYARSLAVWILRKPCA